MSLANDSILVTPGTGATVATQLISAKEYQVMMQADESGHIFGSRDTYFFRVPDAAASQVHVAAASTIHWDLFNAHASLLVRVTSILQLPNIVTVVTGVATSWTLQRTSAVGTGGAACTAWLPDTSQTALDAAITCRSKPTGGATPSTILKYYTIHSEETNAATQMLHMMMVGGVANLVPWELNSMGNSSHGILLRQNQGISVTQTTNSGAGNTAWLIGFTVE
jgi:hypothetical protein